MFLIYYLFLSLFSVSAEKSEVSMMFDHLDLTEEVVFFESRIRHVTPLNLYFFFMFCLYIFGSIFVY
jgi:hypothetical protein